MAEIWDARTIRKFHRVESRKHFFQALIFILPPLLHRQLKTAASRGIGGKIHVSKVPTINGNGCRPRFCGFAEFLRHLSRGFRDFMRINAPDPHVTIRTRYHRIYPRSISETPHIHNKCLWVLRGESGDLFGAGLRGHPVPLVKNFKITYPKRETRRQPIDNDNANANGFYLTPQRGFRRLGRPRG